MEQIGFFGDIGCKEGLSAGDKRSMENRIYAWMKEQGQELTAHQIAIGMCLAGIHYSEHRLEERGLIEKTGKRVFDKETGASAGTYRVVEV